MQRLPRIRRITALRDDSGLCDSCCQGYVVSQLLEMTVGFVTAAAEDTSYQALRDKSGLCDSGSDTSVRMDRDGVGREGGGRGAGEGKLVGSWEKTGQME